MNWTVVTLILTLKRNHICIFIFKIGIKLIFVAYKDSNNDNDNNALLLL